MRAADFILERRPVEVAGRRYMVRGLTVGAVVRALDLYRDEIHIAWSTSKTAPMLWASSWQRVVAEWLPNDGRLTEILSLVLGEEPEQSARVILGRVCVEMSDLARIAEVMKLDDPEGADPDALCRDVVDVATRFGCAPHEVMDWPMASFLATRDVLISGRQEQVAGGVNILAHPEMLAQLFPQG